MKFEGFHSYADLVGRRIWLSWGYKLDPLEIPGDLPDVLIRRKQRDFTFPPLVPGDPYLIFDSAAFPPAPVPGSLAVIDLPDEETSEGGLRVERRTVSVATVTNSVPLERQRHVRSVYYDAAGVAVRVRTEVLDAFELQANTPTYYELDDGSAPDPQTIDAYRSIAVAGEVHALNRWLWQSLPDIYRAHDTRIPPASAFAPGVPEASRAGGQLRRFVDIFGMGFDMLRNSAQSLRGLRNLDSTAPDYLRLLGRSIGWDPSTRVPLPQQRNEIQTATRLFDVLGTVQSLRALVTHQTGWRSQVAELAQNIARANHPAARSLYVRAERQGVPPGEWRGAEDAADIFTFPVIGAVGAGNLPATLLSAATEPFALRAGMELTLSVDGNVPVRIRFGPYDFARIEAATAAEVAAVINHAFDDVVAGSQAGAVGIETVLTGPDASLRVENSRQSLLALSEVPAGSVVPIMQASGHLRVFYRQRFDASLPGDSGIPERHAGQRRLYHKSWGHGAWRDELALPEWTEGAAEVNAAVLPDDRIWVFWTGESGGLAYGLGRGRAPQPATLTNLQAQPFQLVPGTQVSFLIVGGVAVFTVNAPDYAVPLAATALEVAAAMNAQMAPQLTAQALPDGSVRLRTAATGDGVALGVDLSASTAARALGFGARELVGSGRWDPEMDWDEAGLGLPVWNRVTDPTAVADPSGGALAAWAEHQDGAWQIRQAHWSERITLATTGGVAQQTANGPWTVWTTLDGLPNDDIRAVVADAAGTLWFATGLGLARRRADGTFTSFTTIDGLASNDLRALAILPSGVLACATPAGLSEIDTADVITSTVATPDGLPSSDIRAVSASGTGELWVATPVGIARRDAHGMVWRRWGVADGLPAQSPVAVATAPGNDGGRVASASAAGVSILEGNRWRLYSTAHGLPSNDVRALAYCADGALLAATAAGLGRLRDGRWTALTTVNGLPVNDLLAVAQAADGRLLLGSNVGLAVSNPQGTAWSLVGLAQGLPSTVVAGIHANWSAPRILVSGPGATREPHLAVEGGGETWLLWSRRESAMAGHYDSWTLRLRRYDPVTATWGGEQMLTAPIAGGSADRAPWAQPAPGGGFRIFFASNRQGGEGLAWLSADATGLPGAVSLMPVETAESGNPAAVTGPTGEVWLFHRADTPVVQAQVTPIPPPGAPGRFSLRLPDAAALSHRAGGRSPVLAHTARHALRRRFADFLTYTPEYPDRVDADLPGSSHLYTRRTLALYMRQAPFGRSVTHEEIARLLQLLNKLKPINLRLLLVIAPDPLTEILYPAGADIGEGWADNMPIVDILGGLGDSSAVTIPGLAVLLSNDIASRSANILNLQTLLRRTWYPDLL
jgi:hypothetical protein